VSLEAVLKDAIASSLHATLAEKVQDIVAKEARRALREHEDRLTALIRASVAAAIAELLQ
jgi:hypothetical protein